MSKLREFIPLNEIKTDSKFSITNYNKELNVTINELAKNHNVTIFSKSHSPLTAIKYSESSIIEAIIMQSYPIEINPKKQYIITCNPSNKITQKKFKNHLAYLTPPTTFIHLLANQLNNPIEGLSNIIYFIANKFKSSDIHISEKKGAQFKKNGHHQMTLPLPSKQVSPLIYAIKLTAKMDPSITKTPQDGAYQFNYNKISLDIRAASLPTHQGEMLSLRLFDKHQSFVSLESLGFSKKKCNAIQTLLQHPHGLILITGATGSGKSTTLYTLLKTMKKQHIITLEDPVEKVIPSIHQTTVNQSQGYTMATSLKAILRHNPDVIAIGEIRDKQTAQTVINAAYSGHLIIASLHTNSIETTLHRLANLGCSPFLISYCLRGIISQTLRYKNQRPLLESDLLICQYPPVIISDIKKELTEFMKKNIRIK